VIDGEKQDGVEKTCVKMVANNHWSGNSLTQKGGSMETLPYFGIFFPEQPWYVETMEGR
jgi:hypothetical protein